MMWFENIKDITYLQISYMKHAVGFDSGLVRGTKHRRMVPYRNFYDAGDRDIPAWDDLVRRGLAVKKSNHVYAVSQSGAEFLSQLTQVRLIGYFPAVEEPQGAEEQYVDTGAQKNKDSVLLKYALLK